MGFPTQDTALFGAQRTRHEAPSGIFLRPESGKHRGLFSKKYVPLQHNDQRPSFVSSSFTRVSRSDGVALAHLLSFPFRFLRGLTRVNESYPNVPPLEPCMSTLFKCMHWQPQNWRFAKL